MQQKTLDFLRKIVTIVLACLMLVVMLPSGWLFRNHSSTNNLDYVQKVYPSYTAFVDSTDTSISGNRIDPGILWVGEGREGYLQFSLADVHPGKDANLTSAKLRLTVISGAGQFPREIQAAQVKNNNWNLSMTYGTRPQGEEMLLTAVKEIEGAGSILEIDITNAVQNWIVSGEKIVTLHLYGGEKGETAFASERNKDSALHPYLKLLWGNAVDTDPATAEKTKASDMVFVSSVEPDVSGISMVEKNNGVLKVDNEETAYVKFNMIRENIRGAVSKATLILYAEKTEENAILVPSLLENSQWNQLMNYQNRPQGRKEPFGSYRVEFGKFALDVTQAVSEQFQNNADAITFILEGTGNMVFSGAKADKKEQRPYLLIETSEDPNVIAVHETMVNLLKNNLTADNVTSDLRGSYTADAGARATVDWQVYDAVTGEKNSMYIAVNGGVTRPKWFEGEKKLRAVANIQSGTCQLKRTLVLTLPPETEPVIDTSHLIDTVLIGDEKSETEQGFDYVRGSRAKTRNVKGTEYTYRTLGKDGAMVINLKCNPEKINTLYVKLWDDDVDTGNWFFCDPNLGTIDPAAGPENKDELWIPMELRTSNIERDAEGFVYASFTVPESYTKGKNFVSFRLIRTGGTDENKGLFKRLDEGRGIYSVTLKSE